MDLEKAAALISSCLEHATADPSVKQILKAKDEVLSRYGQLFTESHIPQLTIEEFQSFLSFNNNRHWTGLTRPAGQIRDIQTLRNNLAILLDETTPVASRMNEVLGQVRGIGNAIASAVLHVAHPDLYAPWNNTTKAALKLLGLLPSSTPKSHQGEYYDSVNNIILEMSRLVNLDVWDLDAIFWYIAQHGKDTFKASNNGKRTLQTFLERVLELQSSYDSRMTTEMRERGDLIRSKIPGAVRNLLNSDSETGMLEVDGSDGAGSKAAVPWVRIFSREVSPNARTGYYAVFLFARDGSAVFLSANQGTTDQAVGAFTGKSPDILTHQAELARLKIKENSFISDRFIAQIDLRSDGRLAQGYEIGNIYSVQYNRSSVPNDETILDDLRKILSFVSVAREGRTYPSSKIESAPTTITYYTPQDAARDLFFPDEEVLSIVELLKHKKNLILQGPPGVGKTYAAKRLAYALMGERDESRIGWVQFHQSYAYEDFMQGWRPSREGFVLKPGLFYRFCETALQDKRPHVFIIDEINRGNLSRIFGEVLSLIETDKRGSEFALSLTYEVDGSHSRFSVPENIYLVGMMNTADRSLAMVDYALRRRFVFINLRPQFRSSKYKTFCEVVECLTDC